MFYQLIKNKRDEWYSSTECTVRELVNYIEKRGMMRNAQVEAVKTYLFLKIACVNNPLCQLFSAGRFNSLNEFLRKYKNTAYQDGTLTSDQKPLRMKIRSICGDETIFVPTE